MDFCCVLMVKVVDLKIPVQGKSTLTTFTPNFHCYGMNSRRLSKQPLIFEVFNYFSYMIAVLYMC